MPVFPLTPSMMVAPHLRLVSGADAPSDGALVQRGASGDRAALGELYDRHARALFARMARLLGRSAEAEDVVQDAFLQAFRDLGQLREPERFGSWLVGVAVHQAHRRFRRRRLLRRLGLDRGEDDARLEVLARDLDPEQRAELGKVDAILARLTAKVRVAWMLRVVEGYALGEIVELTGASLATVKRRIRRAEVELSRFVAPSTTEEP